jgi:hypothetical protein
LKKKKKKTRRRRGGGVGSDTQKDGFPKMQTYEYYINYAREPPVILLIIQCNIS